MDPNGWVSPCFFEQRVLHNCLKVRVAAIALPGRPEMYSGASLATMVSIGGIIPEISLFEIV